MGSDEDSPMDERRVRAQVAETLGWHDARVGLDKAVAGMPQDKCGSKPAGLPYSPWQVLEHIRRAQRDILEFCTRPEYRELSWPDDYWPRDAAPPNDAAWDQSVRQIRTDRDALQAMVLDPQVELTHKVPNGDKQTYLREVLLVIDHTSYHLGELIVLRRLLGCWATG
jgi:uncharacterized damage-inducible protein DinB